jgi:hypothetical protein
LQDGAIIRNRVERRVERSEGLGFQDTYSGREKDQVGRYPEAPVGYLEPGRKQFFEHWLPDAQEGVQLEPNEESKEFM